MIIEIKIFVRVNPWKFYLFQAFICYPTEELCTLMPFIPSTGIKFVVFWCNMTGKLFIAPFFVVMCTSKSGFLLYDVQNFLCNNKNNKVTLPTKTMSCKPSIPTIVIKQLYGRLRRKGNFQIMVTCITV